MVSRIASERSPKLQGEERIATRSGVDALERRARERHVESGPEQLTQLGKIEWPDRDPDDVLPRERIAECRPPLTAIVCSPGEEDANWFVAQASNGKAQGNCRGRVEPLDIVDGDQYRPTCCESSECIQERHSDGSGIRRSAIGFLTEQCNLERSVLRGR